MGADSAPEKLIRIFLGKLGSGKTACCVKELMLNPADRYTVSNIITKGIPNNIIIKPDWIVNKELVKTKKDGEEVYRYSVNKDFWVKLAEKHKCLNVIIDEAHSVIDSRRSMSNINKVLSDWMALLRRVLGRSPSGYGCLTLISQISRRLDVNALELATQIRYHVCHYIKECQNCGLKWEENNEQPEHCFTCPKCKSHTLVEKHHCIEVWHFSNLAHYQAWMIKKTVGIDLKTYYDHYLVEDIGKYFKNYNTLQWENLISDL